MKRIVFVSPYGHHGATSGARRRAEELCQSMMAEKMEVVCMSPWLPPVGVHHISFSLDGSLLNRVSSLASLMWILHKINPDLVVSESPLCPISFGRFKVLHMIHDSKFSSAYARRGAFLTRLLQWLSVRIADKVITVSFAERKRISTQLGISLDRIVVSYNGLSEPWVTIPLPSTNSRREFDVLYVSNFAFHKGHLNLLRLIAGQNIKVAFVGADFGELDVCKRFAKEQDMDVTFFSNLSESELIALYDNSRVFVFPSCFEGFGMPYIEATARGLPVMANCIPVFQELQSLIGGCVVDFENQEQVVSTLKSLLSVHASTIIPPESLSLFRWDSISETLVRVGSTD